MKLFISQKDRDKKIDNILDKITEKEAMFLLREYIECMLLGSFITILIYFMITI